MAYLIDGSTELIKVLNYAAIDNTSKHTWSVWLNWNAYSGSGLRVIDKRQAASQGMVIWDESATTWSYYDYRWTTTGRYTFTDPAKNQWVHFCLTHDSGAGATPVIYFDGVSQTVTVAAASGGSRTNADISDLTLGNRTSGGRYLDADMAEFGMWDRILSAGEVAALAKRYTPDHVPSGLVCYLPLVRDANNKVAGLNGTVTAATVSNHSPVIRPSTQILQFPPVAAGGGSLSIPVAMNSYRQRNQFSIG